MTIQILKKIPLLLMLAIVAYIILIGSISMLRHYHFLTQTWDLGAFVQTFWNTIDGRFMMNNIEEAPSHFGVHFSPILILMVPGYFIFESPYYLLALQTIILALGAIPLYAFANSVLHDKKIALILSIGYLLYPSTQWMNTYDFHAVTASIPFMFGALYYFEKSKFWKMSSLLALAAFTREDIIILVLFFGIFSLIYKNSRNNFDRSDSLRVGTFVIVSSLILFILVTFMLMPAFGGGLLRLDRYSQLGPSIGEIIKTGITNPALILKTIFIKEKIIYVLWLFLPVAFIPLFHWRSFVLVIPGLLENLLTDFSFQFTGLYHYDAILVPGIFAGTVYGIAQIRLRKHKYIQFVPQIILATLIVGFLFRAPTKPYQFPVELYRARDDRAQTMKQMVEKIPPRASVAAHTNFIPHLSNREHAYMFGDEKFETDYILIDGKDPFGFIDENSYYNRIQSYIDTGHYMQSHYGPDSRFLLLIRIVNSENGVE